MENIFIPTKGRAGKSPLLNFVTQNEIKVIAVVEPEELETYKNEYPGLVFLVLPSGGNGISYVRNFIKSHAENINLTDYWQLDDDISGLFYRDGTKLIRSEIGVLTSAKKQFIESGVSLGSLEYRQFAWSATKDLVLNSFCDTCVWVDLTKMQGIKYRPYLEGKEDRDFAMQAIKAGLKTGRTTKYAFSSPANGSNAGGLKEIFYDKGLEEVCVARMVETWGSNICVPIKKESGRPDVKINWNEIKSTQQSLF